MLDCYEDITAVLSGLVFLFLSVFCVTSQSFFLTGDTHTQLTSQKHAIGKQGICAFINSQRPYLGKV